MVTSTTDTGLPTQEEHTAAMEKFLKGDFEATRHFLERRRDWFLQAGSEPFSRDKFIAGRKSHGEPVDEVMVSGARRLVEDLRRGFLHDAAEAASMLGALAAMMLEYDEAIKHYEQAAMLNPSNTQYLQKAQEYKARAAEKIR
jgi:hypothetical protein